MNTKLLFTILLAINGLSVSGQIWSPVGTGVDSFVQSSVIFNGNLYIGGKFSTAGGNPANEIAMWDGTTWTALGTGMGGSIGGGVLALAVYNGELYAGGLFTTAGGVAVNNIAEVIVVDCALQIVFAAKHNTEVIK